MRKSKRNSPELSCLSKPGPPYLRFGSIEVIRYKGPWYSAKFRAENRENPKVHPRARNDYDEEAAYESYMNPEPAIPARGTL